MKCPGEARFVRAATKRIKMTRFFVRGVDQADLQDTDDLFDFGLGLGKREHKLKQLIMPNYCRPSTSGGLRLFFLLPYPYRLLPTPASRGLFGQMRRRQAAK
jgi:hypothetical protein